MSDHGDDAKVITMDDIHLKVGEEDFDESLLPLERRAAITQFRVFARLRPFIREELERIEKQGEKELRSCVEMEGDSTYPLNPQNGWKPGNQFVFDRSLWSIPKSQKLTPTAHFYHNKHEEVTDQASMYKVATTDEGGVSMVDNAFLGINSCVLAYGQTGSGKTYTMMGKYNTGAPQSEHGLIPRVCQELFEKLQQRREYEEKKEDPSKRWNLTVTVNFIEIYLDKVRDLLDRDLMRGKGGQAKRALAPGGRRTQADMQAALAAMKEARVRTDPVTGPFVEGIEYVTANSWQDCVRLLEAGSSHRTTAQTTIHDQSSRSHAIFTLNLVQERVIAEDRTGTRYDRRTGRINLVDLAGSERGGTEAYVAESAAINKSLTTLRRVIDALVTRQEKIFERQAAELEGRPVSDAPLPHVPYKDTVLTELLRDSIGGNAKTVMVANMSPYHEHYAETVCTIEWAQKAKKLVTVVRTNIDEKGMVKDALSGQIGRLGQESADAKARLESLTDEMKNREKQIGRLKKQNTALEERLEGLKNDYTRSTEDRAAATIQLAMYQFTFRKTRARRRGQVLEAEGAAAAAQKQLKELEQRHEALTDSLLQANVAANRMHKKAEEVEAQADQMIEESKTKKQRSPGDLKAELDTRKKNLEGKMVELEQQQNDLKKADDLLAKYRETREKEMVDAKVSSDRAASDMYTMRKDDVLVEILGSGMEESEYALTLREPIGIDGGMELPLFAMGEDGIWGASSELNAKLSDLEKQKADAEARLKKAKEARAAAETKRDGLKAQNQTAKARSVTLVAQMKDVDNRTAQAKSACMPSKELLKEGGGKK